MLGYIHATRSNKMCCCILSKDKNATIILKCETAKDDNIYKYCLECIQKWKSDLQNNNITRLIITSDKRSIWQHVKKTKKRKKNIYDFEKALQSQLGVELYIAYTVNYSKASRFCKEEYLE